MLTNSMLRESTPARTQELVAETDLSHAQIALRSLFSDQSHFSPVEKLDRFAQANYDKRVIHLALRWVLDRPGVGVALLSWGGGSMSTPWLRSIAFSTRQSLIQSGLSLWRRRSAMLRKKSNRLDLIAAAAGHCICVSGLTTSGDAESSGRGENGERGNVGGNQRMWETTHGNC